tara:strand:+ start:1697 stop:2323 length:627 start_codon:yes stop_codon:yes gene_type:complete
LIRLILKKIANMMMDLANVNARNIPKLSMEKAAAYVFSQALTKQKDFKEAYKDNRIPRVIPRDPRKFYTGFKSWAEFIDIGEREYQQNGVPSTTIPTYDTLREEVQKKHISTRLAYNESAKNGELGELAPARPDIVYQEFRTWSLFLAKSSSDVFLSFSQAKTKVKEMGIKTSTQWFELCSQGNRPPEIPFNPKEYYSEWQGWTAFLK